MRRTFILVLLFQVIISPLLSQEELRVMTYNIKYDDRGDTLNNWDVRRPWVVELLKYHKPAVVGLQEALYHQVMGIKSALDGYTFAGVGRDDGKNAGEFSPVFYDSTRFSLITSGTFWLSETPDRISKGWDAALPRICTFVELQTKDGFTFVVYNAHFDHIGEQARRESVRVIREHMRNSYPNLPAVFMGDLNFTDTDPAYASVLRDFSDARSMTEPYGPKATFNGFNWDKVPSERIDYIFLRGGFQASSFAVLTDSRFNRYPSDHFPVIAEIRR